MRKSLFGKYFATCTMCVLISMLVLGGILMVFAARYFEKEKFSLLERSAAQAAATTAETFTATGPNSGLFKKEVLALIYSSLSTSIDGEFWLTDTGGSHLYHWTRNVERTIPDEKLSYLQVAPEAVEEALVTGLFEETGTLGGLYVQRQYVVGVPVQVRQNVYSGEEIQRMEINMAVLFVAVPADSQWIFLQQFIEMFLLSAVVVLAVAFVLIYFISRNMVRPLKQMLTATNSFSKGDFTMRVPVEGYDEVGQLSMAFNNMASTLAVTESSRRSFVANVSHELKTPMTTIAGFVDGILDGTVPEEKQTQYLQIVSSEVKRLSRLVRSMLDTTRIEAGELEVTPNWFDISELNRQSIFSFEQVLEEKQIEVQGLEVDKIMIWGDRDLMNQVVYNLIENAVKFVNEGGCISFTYRQDNRMTYIAIRNTGEGLESDEIPRLFDRFFKSDRSRSLNKGGVGLGLHIVRTIINYHKGEVVVRSAPGKFTEFEIALPTPRRSMKEN